MTPDTEKLTHGQPHERDEAILELVVAPAGVGKFTARLDGRQHQAVFHNSTTAA
jgi:hypothetical protein